jgi:diguanylate cyclase (GGDEF)-like protein
MIHTQPIVVSSALRDFWMAHTKGLRFGPALEQRFMEVNATHRLRHMLVTGVVALVMFNSFLFSDWYMVPDVFDLALKWRLGIVTPLVMVVLIMVRLCQKWWLANTPPWLVDALGMLGTMLVTLSLGVVLMATQSPQVVIYRAGLIAVLMFGNLVQRLRFRHSLAASTFVVIVYVYTALAWHGPANPYAELQAPVGLLVGVVAFYTLMSNYNLELDERRRFLQRERAQALRLELERTNLNLADMSNQDPLTALANRRCFDAYLNEWMDRPAGRHLALLMLDVDHFKSFNDHYGHPAGDQCLRHIARALQSELSGEGALVSRWGGEEFAVILPEAAAADAWRAAERLRHAVQALAMRHEASGVGGHVTVSVGVAIMSRTDPDRQVSAVRLLAEADQALYRSKHEGRNRCSLVQGLPLST